MRAHLNKAIIRKVSGTPADGSVQVYEAGTTTPLVQTIYVGDTGVTARANPFTFTNGVVEFYLDTPQRVKLVITPTGGSAQTFDNVDVEPPASTLAIGVVGDITSSAVADTAAAGAVGKVADAGHRHAREGFGTVSAETSFGLAAANGTAVTEARSDHVHGTPATPVTSIAVAGTGLSVNAATGAVTITGAAPGAGAVLDTVATSAGNYAVAAGVSVVLQSGTFTVTLPSAVTNSGRRITVKNTGTGVVTLASAAGTIDGAATVTIAKQYNALTVVSDGANWFII